MNATQTQEEIYERLEKCFLQKLDERDVGKKLHDFIEEHPEEFEDDPMGIKRLLNFSQFWAIGSVKAGLQAVAEELEKMHNSK